MGYSSTREVDNFLAQALTSARPSSTTGGPVKLIEINNTRDFNRIPDSLVEYYISAADSEIDSILSNLYYTPFKKCSSGHSYLDEDINIPIVPSSSGSPPEDSSGEPDSSSSTTIVVDNATNLLPGDEIIIHNDATGEEEYAIVATLVDQYTFTVEDPVEGTFNADDEVRIIRNQFPAQVRNISARYAASFIYDKFFAAQADPNMSDYGKEMRNIAQSELNDVLNGKVHLKCARRRGDLFGQPYASSTHSLNEHPFGFNTTERNMSKLN